jgi:hypothetical protein
MAEPAHNPDIPTIIPGKMLTTAEVVSLSEFAAKRAAKFGAMIDSFDAGIAGRVAEAARSLAAAGFDPKMQADAAEKTAAKARAEVRANSEAARYDALRELDAAARSLGTTEALFASPVVVLARQGLGTPERSHLTTQLAGAERAELGHFAQLAVATGNKVLGAAVAAAVDRLPRRDRPVSVAELASALVGEETRAVQKAIDSIKTAVQASLLKNREWESGKARPLDRVKLALNRKEA